MRSGLLVGQRAGARLRQKEEESRVGWRFRQFGRKYWDDPAGFVQECVRWREDEAPAHYQLAALADIVPARRIAIRAPHGTGKSTAAALACWWFILTRSALIDERCSDWKVLTTASVHRQLKKYLWPEIHKWGRRIAWGKVGREPPTERELLRMEFNQRGPRGDVLGQAMAVASSNAEFIEGAHAEQVFYVFDEAKRIPDETWDAAEGAFASGECYAMAISTPGPPIGRFYDIHRRREGLERWQVRHITSDDAIAAGRMNAQWAEDCLRLWGDKSAVYRNRVLGEFAEDEGGVIPLSWIEEANDRWHEWNDNGRPGPLVSVGVDVGETDDPTVLALRHEGNVIGELRVHPGIETMQTVAKVEQVLAGSAAFAVVDAIGLGAGVVSRLNELGYHVIRFVAGAKSQKKDRSNSFGFADVRSEAWWNLREMLDPESGDEVALPPDDKLTGELTAPTYREVSGARLKVESKDEIRKRIGRSTDRADAVMQVLNYPEKPVDWKYVSVEKRRSGGRQRVWRR